jgi:hypothetical protein
MNGRNEAHLREGQVSSDESVQKSTTPLLVCAPVSAPLPVSAPAAPIARVEGGKFAAGRI